MKDDLEITYNSEIQEKPPPLELPLPNFKFCFLGAFHFSKKKFQTKFIFPFDIVNF